MRKDIKLPKWFLPSYKWLVILVFGLIVLGGSVRLMNAGLSCPDWPLCFGDLIPDFHPQVYFEFIHRVIAGLIGCATIILQMLIFMSPRFSKKVKIVAGLSLVLLISQIILGGLTVLWQLKANIVASHLALGTAFFATLAWLYLSVKDELGEQRPATASSKKFAVWSTFVLIAVYGQVILGGLVASNYAALACPDFPTCNGIWFPALSGPIGYQMVHRFGAYTVFLIIVINWIVTRKLPSGHRSKSFANYLGLLVFVQVGLGISNILLYRPPLLAATHLACGALLLFCAVNEFHGFTRSRVGF